MTRSTRIGASARGLSVNIVRARSLYHWYDNGSLDGGAVGRAALAGAIVLGVRRHPARRPRGGGCRRRRVPGAVVARSGHSRTDRGARADRGAARAEDRRLVSRPGGPVRAVLDGGAAR